MFSPPIVKPKLETRSDGSASAGLSSLRFAATGASPIIQAGVLAARDAAQKLDTVVQAATPVVAQTLSWSDFPVVPARINGHSAQTGFAYRGTSTGFTLAFVPATSWSVVADQTDDLLRHEQYHLNLAAVVVTKANVAFAAGTMTGPVVTAALKAAMAKHQGAYETDTGNGTRTSAQASWESDIDAYVPVFPVS
jgi:hypothetical protein